MKNTDFKLRDWVYTDRFNVGGYKAGIYQITRIDEHSSHKPCIAVNINGGSYCWCYAPFGTITRLAFDYEIPGYIPPIDTLDSLLDIMNNLDIK